MNEFNVLEKAILQWFIDKYNDPHLTAQIKSAQLTKREWTKVGFYIGLEVPKTLEPVDVSIFYSKSFPANDDPARNGWPISGPQIESDDIEFGGGSLLWGKDGYIDCIEMYANGSFLKENVDNFKLSTLGNSYIERAS